MLKKDINLLWSATIEASIFNRFDKEVVDLMAESGSIRLFIGAETAFPTTMELIKKNIKHGDILRSCERCEKRGIVPTTSYMVGFPGESEESIQETIKESCEVIYRWPNAEVPINIFVPLPGTPLYVEAVKMGYEPPKNLEYYSGLTNKYMSKIISSLNKGKKRTIRECQPELFSSISPKQLKTIPRCLQYYFWWGSARPGNKEKVNIYEKVLNKTSRFRLKHKLLAFPIEYQIYNYLRQFRNLLRSFKRFVRFKFCSVSSRRY
jgi:radical SAM superfamily enzyme YgiQ (UPF0313 family)